MTPIPQQKALSLRSSFTLKLFILSMLKNSKRVCANSRNLKKVGNIILQTEFDTKL